MMKLACSRVCLVAYLAFAAVSWDINPRLALADEADARCADVSVPRDAMAKQAGGVWIELTDIQRAFAAGVYVLDPNTPAGLPIGDKAALARVSGDEGGVIFFIDGGRACSPMPVPAELIKMLEHIGQADVFHEGQSN